MCLVLFAGWKRAGHGSLSIICWQAAEQGDRLALGNSRNKRSVNGILLE